MRVSKPLSLTLVSTNVANSTLDEWSAGVAYSVGAKVKVTNGLWPFREYESMADDNTGNVPISTPSKWLDLGPINRHSMFDDRTGTITTNAGGIDVTVEPGSAFDTIALINLFGVSSVEITVTRLGQTLFSANESVVLDSLFSDSDYCDALIFRPNIAQSDASVRIKLNGSSVGCGHCMIAKSIYLGDCQYGASTSIEDYSTKEKDSFGVAYLMQREFSKKLSVEISFPTDQYDSINRGLAALRATPALWDANGEGDYFQSLVVFGFLESFAPTIAYHSRSHCSIDVEGLV